MRLSLRFVLPLTLVLAAIAYAVTPLVDQLTQRWFIRDLDIRASLVVNTIQEPLEDLLESDRQNRVREFFNRITQDERLYALGYCSLAGGPALASLFFPAELSCEKIAGWESESDHLLERPPPKAAKRFEHRDKRCRRTHQQTSIERHRRHAEFLRQEFNLGVLARRQNAQHLQKAARTGLGQGLVRAHRAGCSSRRAGNTCRPRGRASRSPRSCPPIP